jgi:drug/metabolite transporter (DMT)-like permease
MRPTRWYVLVFVCVVAGGAAYLVTRHNYADLPSPQLYALLWLLLLAAAEAYTAMFTRARLHGRAGTRPIDPLVVARLVALAKASSVVGAVAAGAYAGFLGWVAQISSPTAHHDARVSGAGVGASLALVAAALLLEWVCRVPKDDADDPTSHR